MGVELEALLEAVNEPFRNIFSQELHLPFQDPKLPKPKCCRLPPETVNRVTKAPGGACTQGN
jgi:hypothetical protein